MTELAIQWKLLIFFLWIALNFVIHTVLRLLGEVRNHAPGGAREMCEVYYRYYFVYYLPSACH